jgi:hypothetical protein
MNKLTVLAGACMLLALSGCGSDLRESLVTQTIDTLGKTSNTLTNIKESLERLDKAKTDAEKKELLDKAAEGSSSLRKLAQNLQQIKQAAAQLEPASEEVREAYREKFQNSLADATQRVKKEQDKLNQALLHAEAQHTQQKVALTELKTKLQTAQMEFELLSKPQ